MAAAEVSRLQKQGKNVYREDLQEGRKVVLSTQTKGYLWNGSVSQKAVIDCIQVSHGVVICGRRELDIEIPEQEEAEIPKRLYQAVSNVLETLDSEIEEEDFSEELEIEDEIEEEDVSESVNSEDLED